MSELDLTRLEELAERATPGPWKSCADDDIGTTADTVVEDVDGKGVAYDCLTTGDAEFIAAMRNAVPSLLAAARAVERVRELVDRAEKRMGGGLRSEQAVAALRAMKTVSGDDLRAAMGGAE